VKTSEKKGLSLKSQEKEHCDTGGITRAKSLLSRCGRKVNPVVQKPDREGPRRGNDACIPPGNKSCVVIMATRGEIGHAFPTAGAR